MTWNKILILGSVVSVLLWSTLRGRAKERWLQVSERYSSVTSTWDLKLIQQQEGLALSQAAAACDCMEVSSTTFAWYLPKFPAFRRLFSTPVLPGRSKPCTQVNINPDLWLGVVPVRESKHPTCSIRRSDSQSAGCMVKVWCSWWWWVWAVPSRMALVWLAGTCRATCSVDATAYAVNCRHGTEMSFVSRKYFLLPWFHFTQVY